MSTIDRKLVTIRTIDAINPIEGADAIEVATIGGWNVVVKKNQVKVGDKVCYFEIDSFLPDGNPAWQFLVDKQPRTFEGRVGHRLRTVKLRGTISQGFIVPLSELPQITDLQEGVDYADVLGVVKWEQPLPAELAGQAEGLFPSFISKTDQPRCQNLVEEIFGYDPQPFTMTVWLDINKTQPKDGQLIRGRNAAGGEWEETWDSDEPLGAMVEWMPIGLKPAKADRSARYEVTMKMDGSSGTFFNTFEGGRGVCSRNLQLKDNEANADNTFVKLFNESGLKAALDNYAIAVQGEVMGHGIQGNRENLKQPKLFIFDMQGLAPDADGYLTPEARYDMLRRLYAAGLDPNLVVHAPVRRKDGTWTTRPDLDVNVDEDFLTLDELGITNVKELLAFAEGPSLVHPVREGLVFKRIDGNFSFKAISNQYLAKEKD